MQDTPVCLEAEFTLFRSQLREIENRSATRWRCRLAAHGHLSFDDTSFRLVIWPANLSEGGIGFNANWPLDPGTSLIIALPKRGGGIVRLPAKVIHATKQPGDGWLIGCAFAKQLDAETIEELL